TIVERARRLPQRPVSLQRFLELFHAAEGRAGDDREARRIAIERGAPPQVFGRAHEQLRRPASGKAVRRERKLLDLGAPADAQIVDRKALDRRDAIDASEQRRPEALDVRTDRRDDTGGQDGDRITAQARDSRGPEQWVRRAEPSSYS